MNYACRMAAPDRPSRRIHPAWVVLGSMTLCMAVASGLRAVFGVYVKPLEAEFGWSRGAISGVAALSLLILGAVGPFAGRLADRWGPRRVTLLAVGLLGAGAIGASAIHTLWQAYLTTGILMGVGSGGLGLATGSVIAARWFESRRGLAIGIAAGGMSAGQLVVIPIATVLLVWFVWRHRPRPHRGAGSLRAHAGARWTHGSRAARAVLAAREHVVRVRVHVGRADPHPLHPPRARAQLLSGRGDDRARHHGLDERGGNARLGLALRSFRPPRPAGHVLPDPRRVAGVPALRVERALAARVGGHLRAQLGVDGAPDHHADRVDLRAVFGRRAVGLDLLRPPGRLRAQRAHR